MSFRRIPFKSRVQVRSQVFVKKIQQSLNFRCQARWAKEEGAQRDRLGYPSGQYRCQSAPDVWTIRQPQGQNGDTKSARRELQSNRRIAGNHAKANILSHGRLAPRQLPGAQTEMPRSGG